MKLFEELNERQLKAVQTTEGYLRVIAGAGSGKTKLLVSRYAYLVNEYGIDPGNILCVTFTNKAAGEMKRRIRTLIGSQYDTSLICTYHGFCVRVLRDDVEKIFFPKEFQIIDTVQQKEIIGEIYSKHELKLDHASFEKVLKDISFFKANNRNYVAKMCRSDKCSITGADVENDLSIIEEYMQKQKEIYALDFSDLIYFTLDVFKRCPEVLKKWQDKLNYIQVDEFQDSSTVEMELIDDLAGGHGNLMIVGDPDQNIYEWRGSDVKLLVDFDKTHEGTETVFLNRNYRSTPQILKCANTLIDKNKYRLKKDLFTLVDSGIEVVHFHAKSDYEEADKIIERIRAIKKEGSAKYSDFAVLYRSGFLSRIIEKKFTECGLPYEIYGGVKFYLRMEIQDVMAYLKLIAFDGDKAFKRIVNTPKRKFGRAKMQRLTELRRDGETLYETLKENLDDGVIKNSKAKELVETVEEMRSFAAEHGIAEIVEKVCADTGYEAYIRELGDMERFENLAEFKRIASEYEKNYGESVTLRDFINQLSLQMSDSEAEDPDRVKLMTIHAAKGLEFPTVFILGFSEGIFPSSKTIEERKELGLEEERRLCYVAITRAEKRLYLLDSEGASQNGSPKMPSRFLFEIGEENYRRIGTISKELRGEMIKASSSGFADEVKREVKSVGDEVDHPAFGKGRILYYDKAKNNYVISFEGLDSTRTISADFFAKSHRSLPVLEAKHEEARPEEVNTISEIKEKEETNERYLIRQNCREETISPVDKNEEETGKQKRQGPEDKQNSDKVADAPEQLEKEDEFKISTVDRRRSYRSSSRSEEMPINDDTADETAEMAENHGREKSDRVNLWECDDVPKTGWFCTGVTDLGAPVGVCDMCGQDPIRYVHHMIHPAYRPLGVGCICAGKMEGNPERAKQRERDFKNSQSRRENFMKRRWKVSRNNNEYLKIKEHLIVLYKNRNSGLWKYSIDNAFAPEVFDTREEAVTAAFEALERAMGH